MRLVGSMALIAAVTGCVDVGVDPEELGASEEELYKSDAFGWPRDASGVTTTVPVCWDERDYVNWPGDLTSRTAYKEAVRKAMEETWQRESGILFTSWADCHDSNGAYGINLHMSTNTRGQTRSIHPVWEARHADVLLPVGASPSYLRYTAIHEAGHALGLNHEQSRSDNDGRCDESDDWDWLQEIYPGQFATPWDDRSVMNYCAGTPTELSPLDIMGIQRLYGRKPGPNLVSIRGLCAGTAGTAAIPTRCSNAAGALVGGMAPAGDWLRLRYTVGLTTSDGYAMSTAVGGFGPLTMAASPTNPNYNQYKLKDVTILGLAGRRLRVSGSPYPGSSITTWDDGTVGWANRTVAAAETWTFMPDGSIKGYGGLCLDVKGANPASGTPVQAYTCNGTRAQQWSRGPDETLRSAVSTAPKCLEVNRDETDTSTAFPTTQLVRIADCNGSLRQQWHVRGAVTTLDNAGCLAIAAAGGTVSQASCNATVAEQEIDVHW